MSISTYQPKQAQAELSQLERDFIVATQNGLPICAEPFAEVARQLNISQDQALHIAKDLDQRNIIRRIAAVPNHYKLGYQFNGMTVWDINDAQAHLFGDAVGRLPFVSHCYLRPRHLPDWNYNLFAMIHGKSEQQLQGYHQQIKQLLEEVLQVHPDAAAHCQPWQVLKSSKILKKTGLRLKNKQTSGSIPKAGQ
jgi:DNA-binding Lrp family transcriptional regulator